MKLIAAVDKNWAIGKEGKLLCHIPEDMRFFKETTTGHIVVMGRKTLESFPGKRPLKDRVNLVLTRNPDYHPEGVTVVHSREELMEALDGYDTEEVFVIGGDSIYRQLLDDCDTAYITRIDEAFDADAWFPDLDASADWNLVSKKPQAESGGHTYQFTTYRKE